MRKPFYIYDIMLSTKKDLFDKKKKRQSIRKKNVQYDIMLKILPYIC